MDADRLRQIRERAADSTLKWNILLAQSDRDVLLAYADALILKNTALETENMELRKSREGSP